MIERFSDREGYRPPAVQITVREDAPPSLRNAIPMIAKEAGMMPSVMRRVICEALLVPPDSKNNWSEYPNIWEEVGRLIEGAQWYRVYDIAEALYVELAMDRRSADGFEQRLNDFLVANGIGWELRGGQITYRGSEVFVKSTRKVPERFGRVGVPSSSQRNT